MRGLPAIQKEADTIFIHAGMTNLANVGRSIEYLNEEIAMFLQQDQPRTVYDDLIWDRDLVQNAFDGEKGSCELVDNILDGLGNDNTRLIIGHTTVYSLDAKATYPYEPMSLCAGALLDVDVGASRWMRNSPANVQLEVEDGKTVSMTTIHTAPGIMLPY